MDPSAAVSSQIFVLFVFVVITSLIKRLVILFPVAFASLCRAAICQGHIWTDNCGVAGQSQGADGDNPTPSAHSALARSLLGSRPQLETPSASSLLGNSAKLGTLGKLANMPKGNSPGVYYPPTDPSLEPNWELIFQNVEWLPSGFGQVVCQNPHCKGKDGYPRRVFCNRLHTWKIQERCLCGKRFPHVESH